MSPVRFHSLLTLLAIAIVLPVTSIQAGASNKNGNPFGNGSFFSDQGTFSAVIRGNGASITSILTNQAFITNRITNTVLVTNTTTNSTNVIATNTVTTTVITNTVTGTYTTELNAKSNPALASYFLGVVTVTTSTTPYTNQATNGGGASSSPNSSGWATIFTPGFAAPQNMSETTNISYTSSSTNPTGALNFPSSQWSGPAFGVFTQNQLAVTYTLQNTVSSVYGTNSSQTPQVLVTTNVNGAGHFTANLANNYPNQTFTGSGFCSLQPSLASLPTSQSPVLNITNTVSGWRLSQ